MLAHSQGTFCRVVHFRINTTAPAAGLSRVPQKTTKTTVRTIWYHMLVSCCTNPKKKRKKTRLVPVRARTAVKYYSGVLRYRTGKIKSNPLEPHFETLATIEFRVENETEQKMLRGRCSWRMFPGIGNLLNQICSGNMTWTCGDLRSTFKDFSQQASSFVRSTAVCSATFRRDLLLQLFNHHIISTVTALQVAVQLEFACLFFVCPA